MQGLFTDILQTEGVRGVVLLSEEGRVLFERFSHPPSLNVDAVDWKSLVRASQGIWEADMVFERLRLYVRKADTGYLVVFVDTQSSMALIRINVDLVLPSLKKRIPSKGLGRFFKPRK